MQPACTQYHYVCTQYHYVCTMYVCMYVCVKDYAILGISLGYVCASHLHAVIASLAWFTYVCLYVLIDAC